jgi:hypothetical protein
MSKHNRERSHCHRQLAISQQQEIAATREQIYRERYPKAPVCVTRLGGEKLDTCEPIHPLKPLRWNGIRRGPNRHEWIMSRYFGKKLKEYAKG